MASFILFHLHIFSKPSNVESSNVRCMIIGNGNVFEVGACILWQQCHCAVGVLHGCSHWKSLTAHCQTLRAWWLGIATHLRLNVSPQVYMFMNLINVLQHLCIIHIHFAMYMHVLAYICTNRTVGVPQYALAFQSYAFLG